MQSFCKYIIDENYYQEKNIRQSVLYIVINISLSKAKCKLLVTCVQNLVLHFTALNTIIFLWQLFNQTFANIVLIGHKFLLNNRILYLTDVTVKCYFCTLFLKKQNKRLGDI